MLQNFVDILSIILTSLQLFVCALLFSLGLWKNYVIPNVFVESAK